MCSLESGILSPGICCPTTLTETTDSITDYIGKRRSDEEILGYCFDAIKCKNIEFSAFLLQTLAERGAAECFAGAITAAITAAIVDESFATDYQFYSMIRGVLERNYKRLELQAVWEFFHHIKWDPKIAKELPEGTDFAEKKCPRPYEV